MSEFASSSLYRPVTERWRISDDKSLVEALSKGYTLQEVRRKCRLSHNFTVEEVEERWRKLLFDGDTAREAAAQIREIDLAKNKRLPWTKAENDVIMQEYLKRGSVSFPVLLDKYRSVFHPSRTVRSLEARFYRLLRTNKLPSKDSIGKLPESNETSDVVEKHSEKRTFDELEASVINGLSDEHIEKVDVEKKRHKTEARVAGSMEILSNQLPDFRGAIRLPSGTDIAVSKPRTEILENGDIRAPLNDFRTGDGVAAVIEVDVAGNYSLFAVSDSRVVVKVDDVIINSSSGTIPLEAKETKIEIGERTLHFFC